MSADRREIAERHGLPPEFAAQLQGETADELNAYAAATAALHAAQRQNAPVEADYSGISSSGRTLLDQLGLVPTKQSDGLSFEQAHAKGVADLEDQRRADAGRISRRLGGDR